MRPSDRRGKRWNSIRCLLRHNSTWGGCFSLRENLTRQTRLDAKWQSYSRQRLPATDGRCSSLCNVATARPHYAKRNWSLTTGFVLSNWRSHITYVATARRRTRLWPSSWPIAEMAWPIKSPKRTPYEARYRKLSNGCKSRLIITTAGRLALASTHYCVACTTILATRTCSPNSVYLDRHERKALLFRGARGNGELLLAVTVAHWFSELILKHQRYVPWR